MLDDSSIDAASLGGVNPSSRGLTRPVDFNLILACRQGSFDRAARSLDEGADPNSSPAQGFSALICCSFLNRPDMIALLLERGAFIDLPDDEGWSALHWAGKLDRADSARALLESGANAEARSKDGSTPLDLACGSGSLASLSAFLDFGADPFSRSDASGFPSALRACSHPHLIDRLGADRLASLSADAHGRGPLSWALRSLAPAHLADDLAFSCCLKLLSAGADWRQSDEHGLIPEQQARALNLPRCEALLRSWRERSLLDQLSTSSPAALGEPSARL